MGESQAQSDHNFYLANWQVGGWLRSTYAHSYWGIVRSVAESLVDRSFLLGFRFRWWTGCFSFFNFFSYCWSLWWEIIWCRERNRDRWAVCWWKDLLWVDWWLAQRGELDQDRWKVCRWWDLPHEDRWLRWIAIVGAIGTFDGCYFTIESCCCYSPYTSMARAWSYYTKVVSKSYWVTGDGGGKAKGSYTWLEWSSWCGEHLIWLVEASYARVITIELQVPGSFWRWWESFPFLAHQSITVKSVFTETRAVLEGLVGYFGEKAMSLLVALKRRLAKTISRLGFLVGDPTTLSQRVK